MRSARREAKAAFGKDEVYLEKLVRHARHVEVQLLGDTHGTCLHLFERDCSIQRRHQKVIERAPAPYVDAATRAALCDAALRIGDATNYVGAGTVEFLMDADSGKFYFIEVNPRIQVEHTVTEQVTGLDIVKAQIKIADGGRLGRLEETGIPPQDQIRLDGHALQCRITTENPDNNFIPDYGRITAYRGAFGFGIKSMAARPIPARSSPAITTRCSKRSPPGRRRPPRSSSAWIAPCANIAFAASRPTSPFSRWCSIIRTFAPAFMLAI